jgi:hypothetical protein
MRRKKRKDKESRREASRLSAVRVEVGCRHVLTTCADHAVNNHVRCPDTSWKIKCDIVKNKLAYDSKKYNCSGALYDIITPTHGM